MQRNDIPYCDVNWARPFSLPFGIPASGITAAERIQYAVALGATADLPVSTHGKYFAEPPVLEVRIVDAVVLPRHGRDLVPAVRTALDVGWMRARVQSLLRSAFKPTSLSTGTPEEVDRLLQAAIPVDHSDFGFLPVPDGPECASIPIPRLALDSVEVYLPSQPSPWKPAAPFSVAGALDANGVPVAAVPQLLLTSSDVALGEHDRLLLRSPVSGRFRFDPYYLYRKTGAPALEAIGPSSTGRLIIEQPELSSARKDAHTNTRLFEGRTFAFDHVSRDDVAELMHAHLMFQLRHLEALNTAHTSSGGVASLAIPKTSSEVMDWVVSGVNRLLRSWVAFTAVLRWRPEDATAASKIPAAWVATLGKSELKVADAVRLIPIANQVLGDAGLLEAVVFFSRNVYGRRLAGFSWTEILALNNQPSARFPVPNDQPPFTASDAAAKAAQLQHQRLRSIEDPGQRWVACWAGAPVGRPAPVYAPAAAATFPADGVTTYELEALHAANRAAPALGVAPPPATTQAAPGRAADLTAFAGKRVGHACWFTAGPSANPFHTTVDWLSELTQGTHLFAIEDGFVDIMTLIDGGSPAFSGHPLALTIHTDLQQRAVHLRQQLDVLSRFKIGTKALDQASIEWWQSKLNMGANVPPAPTTPTRMNHGFHAGAGVVLEFDDLMAQSPLNPFGRGVSNGFSAFDLFSALLAGQRMGLPLPVLMALMETEGVNLFTSINHFVSTFGTTDPSKTTVWEAESRDPDPTHSLRPPIPDPEAGAASPSELTRRRRLFARQLWLSFPYGLDRFAIPASSTEVNNRVHDFVASGVLVMDAAEDVESYIRTRVFSQFKNVPGLIVPGGVVQIWKRSRRAHWAILSLMAGFYRQLELDARALRNGFAALPPECLPAGASPPPLVVGGVPLKPTDTGWKDYLTFYGMIYFSYNSRPSSLVNFATAAKAALGASPLSLRDFMLFQHSRGNEVIQNVARFVIALDAYLRLDLLDGTAPSGFGAATPNTDDPALRSGPTGWGV